MIIFSPIGFLAENSSDNYKNENGLFINAAAVISPPMCVKSFIPKGLKEI